MNNAHPVLHRAVYEAVEKILTRILPLWENSLAEKPWKEERIKYNQVEYEEHTEHYPKWPDEFIDDEHEDAYDEMCDKWWASLRIIQPEPGEFTPTESREAVNFREHFPNQNLQVIVKLANIELTPDKPDYEGGTWHIEGQLVRNLFS